MKKVHIGESDLDNLPLPFGKYKGQTPGDVAEENPEYIVWLYDNVEPPRCSEALATACRKQLADWEEYNTQQPLDFHSSY